MTTLPPGPRGLLGLREMIAVARDPLSGLEALHARYGKMMFAPLPSAPLSVIFDPEGVEQLVTLPVTAVKKDPATYQLRQILGVGLITTEGDEWRRRRRMIGPFFLRDRVAAYGEDVVALTHAWVDGLDGSVRDVAADLLDLTLRSMSRAILGRDVPFAAEALADPLAIYAFEFFNELRTWRRLVPRAVPTPWRARRRRAVEDVDRAINAAVAARRTHEPGPDILSQMMQAQDRDGKPLSDIELRDECVTLLLAGNETSALAVAYAVYLIAAYPAHWQRLAEEVDTVLSGRACTAADLPALPWLDAVLRETMRLYPPIWVLGRELLQPTEILGFQMPAGSHVGACQYIVHRDAQWYREPLAFRPERWTEGETVTNPKYAYFPFGGGQRMCVGSHFATMQSGLILATLAQRLRPESVHSGALALTPSISLRPRDGLPVRLLPTRGTATSS